MKTIDLSPLYRNSIGFDRLAPMLEGAFRADGTSTGYPPYNIEMIGDNRYAITLAVAGFTEHELDIQVERGVLTVRGEKADDPDKHHYLYQGIATRTFERKFNLAEYVEVTGARLENGLLNINLVQEIPEAMRPKRIEIQSDSAALDHQSKTEQAA
ncbi:MAG: Hsp20 family protein [Gammaproteobacteria bacterium]|jgi:molecular chaperone IbpA